MPNYGKPVSGVSKAEGIQNTGLAVTQSNPDTKAGTLSEGFVHPNSLLGRADRATAAGRSGTAGDEQAIMNSSGGMTSKHFRDIELPNETAKRPLSGRTARTRHLRGRR